MKPARSRARPWLRHVALFVALALPAAAHAQPDGDADALARGRTALARSDYARAEQELEAAAKSPKDRGTALLLRTRLELWTGRYAQAVQTGRQAAAERPELRVQAAPWIAEALVRQGKTDEAIQVLEQVKDEPAAHRVRVALGELYVRRGRRKDAYDPLHALFDAYKADTIKHDDTENVTLVGRAAHLLRQPKNANKRYNEALETGGKRRVETLLWHADLFLDKYNPGAAAESVKQAQKLAPNDPRVHVAWASVLLANAMDFEAADREIEAALKVDPHLAEAYVVRAGLALRDMEIEVADRAVDEGLKSDPENLELLSMKAATRFLAEDVPGFEAQKARVFKLNPEYSSFYQLVGEYAEWEHRYDDIVKMMREAVAIDPKDAKARATLGLNLIRGGNEPDGVKELDAAFKVDGFNMRAYNTLDLFETTIPKQYATVESPTFRTRYHVDERAVLERYVPPMLDEAWASMVKRYGFTPTTPIGVELYADTEHFSVRTSGLPNVGIQGVCFGKTLASLSPTAGPFNWGQIVWHELGHVFAIQQSKNRVPRWFTEGLSEYETIVRRPEWRREEDLSLYLGLRAGKIPKVADFNRAFTHVDDPADVTMAYFAASQIVVFMAEKWGFDKLPVMLRLWGEGKRTPAVVKEALGVTAEELDQAFHGWLGPRLERYAKQFVPDRRQVPLEQARRALADHPQSVPHLVKVAVALFGEGQEPEAMATLALARSIDPKDPELEWLDLTLALRAKELDKAAALVLELIQNGHDGYAVRMRAADVAEAKKDPAAMRTHFAAAHQFDPSQAEPLQALYDLAHKDKDADAELAALRQLWKLDQHDRKVFGMLLELLVKKGYWDEAVAVGESALYVDVENPEVHRLYARALARTGQFISAIYELNSAILAGPAPEVAVQIYRSMAEGYRKLGKEDFAVEAEKYAKDLTDAAAPPAAPGPDAPQPTPEPPKPGPDDETPTL
ncbi:MAG: tetratricopeptide repeat protein [Polyangiaceae bacterium]|nr:tetratricopeptide repeat protein [Polyangiaceae bacterium]